MGYRHTHTSLLINIVHTTSIDSIPRAPCETESLVLFIDIKQCGNVTRLQNKHAQHANWQKRSKNTRREARLNRE